MKNKSEPNLLAVGNPKPTVAVQAQVRATRSDFNLGDLPDAAREVTMLGDIFGRSRSRIYIGSKADETTVKREAPQAGVIHFATHGVLDDKSPMYSWVLLSGSPRGGTDDGMLEAWEVANMELKADLVTLSACDTARGTISPGEGMIGMSWAFFLAGSSSLIASQWQVDSVSTADLMVKMYSSLKSKRTGMPKPFAAKALALREAALNLRRTPQYEAPYYWAGFILVGDPN